MQICQRAALSVICCANASSPEGRAEKLVQAEGLTNQGSSDADLFARCSFRHGLRRATFLKEEGFWGVDMKKRLLMFRADALIFVT